jgi:alkanesulfonate monooxygenase SsuD/methylene tetrahydromethanopterin reductase-like flavin-dependent oxidoreductase (luciferase family)
MAMGGAMMPMPWTFTTVRVMLVMWIVMMAGMMLPSAAPMILLFAAINRQRPDALRFRAAAYQAARPAAEKLTAGYRRGGDRVRRRISTEEELETERWLREVAIVGSPDTVAQRIIALHQELGFGNFMLVTGFLGNLPQEQVVRTLDLFAKEVRPRFERMLERLGATEPAGDAQ